jgi:hypothetical protein
MVVYTPGLVVTTSLYANPVVSLQIASDEIGHSIALDSVKISTLTSCNHEVAALRRRPRPP